MPYFFKTLRLTAPLESILCPVMRRRLQIVSAGLLLCASTAYSLTFSEWQTEHFTLAELADDVISGPNADPEGDGQKNLLEYAFARDPFVSDLVNTEVELGTNGLKITYPQAVGATDLLYHFRESPDLKHWITPNNTSTETLSDDGTVRIVSEFNPFVSPSPARAFAGLRVHVSPNAEELMVIPSALEAALTVPFTVTLRWNDNAKIENAFLIERRTGAMGAWEQYDFASADTNRWEDWNILGSTTYFYRVKCEDEYGELLQPSNEFSISTPLDSDQDGIPDDMEASFGTDPTLFSTGNNSVSDGWWIRYGLSPLTSLTTDTDGDGRSDVEEYFDGTDPNVADGAPPSNSVVEPPSDVALESISSTSHAIQWVNHSPDARRLSVERSDDGGAWNRIATLPPTATTYTDTTGIASAVHFYRIVVHP